MFKRELGISIYPEHFEKQRILTYLDKCKKQGINNVFLSLIHLPLSTDKKIINLYLEVIKYAKDAGYYVILDIADITFNLLDIANNDLAYFKSINIDCVRLDSPLLPKQVADATYEGLDILINMSNNDQFINNVIDYRPRLDKIGGCHNFYPLQDSAPGFDFFIEASQKYTKLNLKSVAFVGSQQGDAGPQQEKVGALVSAEFLRNLDIRTQTKILFATNEISTVIIGNQAASDSEVNQFIEAYNLDKIEFDLNLSKELTQLEKDILNYKNHFWRGDANESLVRSTQPRTVFKIDNPATSKETVFARGDVCIINSNNKHYQNELVIVLQNNYKSNILNKIGTISNSDSLLLDFLKPWDRFKFRVI